MSCAILSARFAVQPIVLCVEISGGPAAVKARRLIERQVGQMTPLVEDFLDVSRVSRGQLRLQLERLDLRAVVTHAAETVEFIMQEHHHRVMIVIP